MSDSRRAATGILGSRIAGLIREIVIVAVLGTTFVADGFRAAMRIPNLLQNLLGEGAVSASFVPVYAGMIEDGRDVEARRLAGSILAYLTLLVTILVVAIVVLARPLVWLLTLGAWSGARYELTIELTRISALGTGLLVLSAFCLGVLNAHRRYLLSYSAPILWSVAQIVALLLAVALVPDVAGEPDLATISRWLTVGMVLGSFLQLVVQVPSVRTLTQGVMPHFVRTHDTNTVFRRFVPALAGRGVVQLSSYVDLALAALLVTGAVATLAAVTPLYVLSISVFGFSVATTELTEMSRRQRDSAAVSHRVRLGLRKVLLPAALVTALLMGAGTTIVEGLYGWVSDLLGSGTFGFHDIRVAGATLTAFAIGLPASMTARVTQNALFALGDVSSPARIAAVRLAVMAVAGFLLMIQFDHLATGDLTADEATAVYGLPVEDGPFDTLAVDGFPHTPPWEPLPGSVRNLEDPPLSHYGPVGLGLGSAIASWVEWSLLRRRLRATLARTGRADIDTGLGPWVAAAGVSAFVAAVAAGRLDLPSPLDLVVVGLASLVVYVGSLRFMGFRSRAAVSPAGQ